MLLDLGLFPSFRLGKAKEDLPGHGQLPVWEKLCV